MLQLLGIRLDLFQVLFEVLEQFYDVLFQVGLQPLLHLLCYLVFLVGLYVLDYNIIQVVVDNLSHFVAPLAVIFALVLP